jgi:hypothetical protein
MQTARPSEAWMPEEWGEVSQGLVGGCEVT